MSDDIRCDVCGNHGRRRMFKHCPEGWFYAEVPIEDQPGEAFVVTACSEKCKARFWLQGPGDLNTEPDYMKENRRD